MHDIRWKQRFSNFEKAFKTYNEALSAYKTNKESVVYRLALIQAFEFTYELSWNLMKDYLEAQGFSDFEKTPRGVIKLAFKTQIILNGDIWADLIDTRNILSHTYNEDKAKDSCQKIETIYSVEFENIYKHFKGLI